MLPSPEQAVALKQTLVKANSAANWLSERAWGCGEFRQFPLHRKFYKLMRETSGLTAQMVIRLIAKVADGYKVDHNVARRFRKYGAIHYDERILRFDLVKSGVSIWTVEGREWMQFTCGERQRQLLQLRKGESDLILFKDGWFLNVTVDVPEQQEYEALSWIGIDVGLVNLAKSSDGKTFGNAPKVASIRKRRWRQRKRLQCKRTRSARRVLIRLRGRESRFIRHTNHTISKQICAVAERTKRGIALENLKGIRSRMRARKSQRHILNSWAFADLQSKITYKCRLSGIPIKFVDPRNTSRTCPSCGHIAKGNRKTRDRFECMICGFTADADTNAACEIAHRAVHRPAVRTRGVRADVQ